MRALGYFRCRDRGRSFEELEEAFSEYCDLNLHQPVRIFVDWDQRQSEGYTEYRGMLEFVRESGSNFLVVVPDASHLGDDLEGVAKSLVELERVGTKLVCADEGYPDPLQNAFQTLGVKGVSRSRSDRIKESMRARALKGQGLGKPPYGYQNGEDGSLEVVRGQAAVVELIYRLYTKDGLGLRLIAQHLNERGIPTRRGGNWNMVTIRDILKNSTYTGTYTRFGMRLPRSHPAIIAPDVFRAARDLAQTRRPVGRVVSAEPFLLSGMAYCEYCGNKMMGVTRRQTWRRKDGHRARGVYRYYQCQSRNNQSICGYHTWRASVLEGTVLGQLRYALEARGNDSDPDVSAARREALNAMRDAHVSNAERRFLQAMRRAARGDLSVGSLGGYLDELDTVRRRAGDSRSGTDVSETLDRWDSIPLAERQSFLMEHVERIVVKDDAVELVV